MRARKGIAEASPLVDAADKFDDVYQRIEALANHAHDLIKYAGDEKLVGDWWNGMQSALQKMQSVSGEIRQPALPGMEHQEESINDTTDHAPVQEENDMKDDMQETISMLTKLAGLGEAGGHKPDADKDGIPDWADKNPHKAGGDEDRIEEAACPTCHQDPCECESVEEAAKNPYAVGMAQAMKSTGDEPPLKKSTINKAHEIAKAVKKEEVEESVDLEECGAAMIPGTMVPELTTTDIDGVQPEEKEMFHLNVKTPNKTMTFVTDDPEEIIRVLRASGVAVEETQSTPASGEAYTPPERAPVPTPSEMNHVADEAANMNYKGPSQVQMNKIEDESYENSAEDNAEDAKGEKRTGMSHDEWENSEEDKAEDAEGEEDEKEVKEGIARLRKLSGYEIVGEGKWGNSVAGPSGDPKVAGNTEDFAAAGTGNAKSGRGDKGLSTFGDNPLGRNDRDLTEASMMKSFESWLAEQQGK